MDGEKDPTADQSDHSYSTNSSPEKPERGFNCSYCSRTFSLKSALTRHLIKFHPDEAGVKGVKKTRKHETPVCLNCYYCSQTFTIEVSLHRHITKFHPEVSRVSVENEAPPQKERFSCDLCSCSFNHKQTLARHMVKFHTEQPDAENGNNRADFQPEAPKPFACNLCSCSFTIKNALTRHINQCHEYTIHANNENKSKVAQRISCEHCFETFLQEKALNQHLKKFHPEMLDYIEKDNRVGQGIKKRKNRNQYLHKSLQCEYCTTAFTKKNNLTRHIYKFHPEAASAHAKKANYICSVCCSTCSTMKLLHKHILEDHPEVKLEFKKFKFNSWEDFEYWKITTEESSKAHFIKTSGAKDVQEGVMRSYFYCHRSGFSKLKRSDRKRSFKSSGSIKIEKSCPAFIMLVKQTIDNNIDIAVEYQSVHLGHEMEIEKLPLTKQEREQLACQLSQGVPKSTVLKRLQKSVTPDKRIGLLSRKDLHNICKSYKIGERAVLDEEDFSAVKILIEKMQTCEYNPVMLCKLIDEELPDFPGVQKSDILIGLMNEVQMKLLHMYGKKGILIDSTNGTKQYGFNLTTLRVYDDSNEGLPVAILYSSRTSQETVVPFFKAIKLRVPELTTDVLISNGGPLFYNAWKIIFGEVNTHLLSSWHVKRMLVKNIQLKIKDPKSQTDVRRKLFKIHKERDPYTFKQMADEFTTELLANDSTRSFGEYFLNHYMNCIEQWALCYRKDIDVNTDVKNEHWLKELRYHEADGKFAKRLDKSVGIIQSLVTEKLIGRDVCTSLGMAASYVYNTRKRHTAVGDLTLNVVTEIERKLFWLVNSVKVPANNYSVQYRGKCSNRECKIKCLDCRVCIHEFTCTCVDYCHRFQMCKHIHLICLHFEFREDEAEYNLNREELESANIILEFLQPAHVSDLEKEKFAASFSQSIVQLVTDSTSHEQIRIIQEGIETIESKWKAAAPNNSSIWSVVLNPEQR